MNCENALTTPLYQLHFHKKQELTDSKRNAAQSEFES